MMKNLQEKRGGEEAYLYKLQSRLGPIYKMKMLGEWRAEGDGCYGLDWHEISVFRLGVTLEFPMWMGVQF
jgi:hypothetical protein